MKLLHAPFVTMAQKKLHLAMVSSPGIGHLSPALLLGQRLVTCHNVRVTILIVTTTPSETQSKLISTYTTDPNFSVIEIPASDISSIVAPDAKVVTRLCVMMRETIPTIRTAISSMDPRPDVLMGDIFANKSWAIAEELKIPKYVFVTGNAWFTGLFAYSPVLDKKVMGQYVDMTELVEIPGCKAVRPEELVDPMIDRDDEVYQVFLDQAVGVTLTDGILINTWEHLEPQSLDALRNDEILRSLINDKPVYSVGPIYKKYEPAGSKNDAMEWLDKQPERSVIYVSFGSGGTISAEQIKELACGLEMSQQRFVWVVRPPSGQSADEAFLKPGRESGGPNDDSGPPDYFPEGFLTRTQKVGFIVPSWAPQVEILNHISVAGFLTHCGWNSTLESITSGVPMIAWPLYAEQFMNATMLVEDLKVAVRPEELPKKKVVAKEEIERLVRLLVEDEEGKAMASNVQRLKASAEEALSANGSSYISTCKFIQDCWSRIL